MIPVVLDTNVFVAAGFRPGSASARLIRAAADGRLRLVWDEPTRCETLHVVRRIPPLDDALLEGLFRDEHRFHGPTAPERFTVVPDPADRLFAALAAAAGATLVSRDAHLLAHRAALPLPVLSPSEAAVRFLPQAT